MKSLLPHRAAAEHFPFFLVKIFLPYLATVIVIEELPAE